MRAVKRFVYALLRPLLIRDVDPNEDYSCTMCGEPVLTRRLVCSRRKCGEKLDRILRWPSTSKESHETP